MANVERENLLGFIDKRTTPTITELPYTEVDYSDVNSLRTRLSTLNAAYYTTARLDALTKNDMVWALRQIDDVAGI